MSEESETKSPYSRALEWAEDIRQRPMTDEQATELAKVYAALASVEAYERAARALEALREPLEALQQPVEQFLAYMGLAGVSGPETTPQDPEEQQ